jgi:putative membrane protein
MAALATAFVLLVAVIHIYILVLEMFLWRTPRGLRAFGTDQAFADQSAPLAANQGLYNGFLAAGLLWGVIATWLASTEPVEQAYPVGFQVKVFFLACVIIAGLYGAATVNRRILVVQAAPAAVALVLVLLVGG